MAESEGIPAGLTYPASFMQINKNKAVDGKKLHKNAAYKLSFSKRTSVLSRGEIASVSLDSWQARGVGRDPLQDLSLPPSFGTDEAPALPYPPPSPLRWLRHPSAVWHL